MAEPLAMSPLLGVALLILLAMAAWSDLRHRRIPHPLVAAVAILWLVTIPALGPGAATVAAVTASGVLALGFLVWRCGWLGGGDVKLIAALSLWAGPDTVSGLLLAIALSGGVLALLMCLATRIACLPIAVAVQVQAARLAPAPPGCRQS